MLFLDDKSEHYLPIPTPLFQALRIVLAKGSNRTEARRQLARRICNAYPNAEVYEAYSIPHNKIDLDEIDPLKLHERGKRTLVLGEHNSAVRFSKEGDNSCPNYWHFSPYGFCPYGCYYCYLAGTPGVWFSPTVKIFLNLPEILVEVDRIANQIGQPTLFYLGKLQDGLALEPLSGYARTMIQFFARHPYAKMVVLTKSTEVENLLDLNHAGRTILSWTVNAPEVVHDFEANSPELSDRISAMRRCAEVGYPLRAVVMPIVPVDNWQILYERFLVMLLESVPLTRITLGSICSFPQAQRLMEWKLGKNNAISLLLNHQEAKSSDGRFRFARSTREQLYRHLIECIRKIRSDIEIGLCLENESMFTSLDMRKNIGYCNCVL